LYKNIFHVPNLTSIFRSLVAVDEKKHKMPSLWVAWVVLYPSDWKIFAILTEQGETILFKESSKLRVTKWSLVL
jgi:hypothetical protein